MLSGQFWILTLVSFFATRQVGLHRKRLVAEPRAPPATKKRQHHGPRHLTIRAVVRPEIDVEKIARVVVMMAIDAATKDAKVQSHAREADQPPDAPIARRDESSP